MTNNSNNKLAAFVLSLSFFSGPVYFIAGVHVYDTAQGETLRNLIVSEAADWQVLTLRLAVHLQALKQSSLEGGGRQPSKQVQSCCRC